MKLPALALVAVALTVSSLATAAEDVHETKGRVVVTTTTCAVLEPIKFAMNDAHLSVGHRKIIHAVAETLLGNPSITLMEIEGFADTHETNPDKLGLARAAAVRLALQAEGVPAFRMQVASLGATRPLDKGITSSGQEKNRRIEFVILRRDPSL